MMDLTLLRQDDLLKNKLNIIDQASTKAHQVDLRKKANLKNEP